MSRFLFLALGIAGMLASAPAFAAGFNYALDELSVTGNLEFFDDFEDGSRTDPPTSSIVDWRGTVAVEEGGFLVLDSDNGSFPRPDLGQNLDWIEGLVVLAPPIVDGGSGATSASASFRPDVPPPIIDGTMNNHYGMVLDDEATLGNETSLEIGLGGLGTFVSIFFFDNVAGSFLGTEFVPIASITGNIVLGLVVDHATDTALPRYSIDGGATFVEGADWANPAVPGPIDSDEVQVNVFAFGYVPEPSASLLIGAGLACLLARRRQALLR